jgi:hypothetical protein
MSSNGLTTARGYGWAHQQLRARLLAVYSPADPCWRCQRPLGPDPELLDLGHVDGDRTRYRGLEHRWCNRATAGRAGETGVAPGAVRERPDGGLERWSAAYGEWSPISRRW